MKNTKETVYKIRETILELLFDDEVATVSTAEAATSLSPGDEILDLEHLDQGVQTAPRKTTPMGRVLAKKSVHEKTWKKILKKLPEPSAV